MFKPLDRFDWSHPKEIDRALVEHLLQLDFVERGENVLLKGAFGRRQDADRAESRPRCSRGRLHGAIRIARRGTVFPGAACGAALIDRFNQHCHKLLITANSWRETHQFDHDLDKPTDPKRPRKRR